MVMLLLCVYSRKQKYSSISIRHKRLQKRYLVFFVAALIITGGAITYGLTRNNKKGPETNSGNPTINNTPATDAEKQETENTKDHIINQQNKRQDSSNPTVDPSSNKKSVHVVITSANRNSVNAYVTGIFEDSGTCTAIFKNNNTTLMKTSTGFKNVSYTQCAPIDMDSGFLNSGSWDVTVKYSSAEAEGVSASQNFEVR